MLLTPVDQWKAMHPNWCALDDVQVMQLPSDTARARERYDTAVYFLVIDGGVTIESGTDQAEASPGDLVVLAPGEEFRLLPRSGRVRMLRLAERPLPPFREGNLSGSDRRTVLLHPAQPLPSPQRRGVSLHYDESKTFSPSVLAPQRGGDILLALNLGALVKSHVKEIRQNAIDGSRAVVGLIVPLPGEEDPHEFPNDPHRWELVGMLRPLVVGIEADLGTDKGRAKAETARAAWAPKLRMDGIGFAVAMAQREWRESELVELFEYLAHVPPANLRLILRWELGGFPTRARGRRALSSLLPWLHALEVRDPAGFQEACHYLDGLGFQGWVLQKQS